MLSRVRHLHVTARILTDALMTGAHRSNRVGQAVEFADYQEYVPGMDLRSLDWRVLARSDRWVVRRYETETELACHVVLDLSGDLGTGSTSAGGYPPLKGSKAGYAISLAATILYWFHRQGEPVGLQIVAGDGVRWSDLPARAGKSHLQRCFLALASAKPGGRAELSDALVRIGRRVRRRSWVAVISDGMEEPSRWLPTLQAFARRRTDLRFVHLYDQAELRLDDARPALFFSPEGGEALAVDPQGAQDEFAEVVSGFLNEVRAGVIEAGGQYVQAPTSASAERVLRRLVHGGSMAVVRP